MLGHYLLTAWRNILKSRSHAAINIIGFAIGMACCLVILLYIRDEQSYDRQNTRGDRIYRVVTDRTARTPGALGGFIANQFPAVEEVLRLRATIGTWLFTTGESQFYEQRVYWADGNLFDVFDVPLIRGNPATALTAPNSMVISASMARKYFGEDDPVGRVITGDNQFPFAITAVMEDPPPYAHFHPDFYVSIATTSDRGDPHGLLRNWSDSQYYTYLLLPDGASPVEVNGLLQSRLGEHLDAQTLSVAFTNSYTLQPLFDIHLYSHLEYEMESNGDVSFIWMMTAITVFILLIACMNFTNLATVRSMARAREIGMRKVAGATRGQIVRQFLGETILFSFVAFLAALGIVSVVYQQLEFMRNKYLGFEKEHVVIMPDLQGMNFGMIMGRFPEHAGVVSVTGATYVPGRPAGRGKLPIFPVRSVDQPDGQPVAMQMLQTTGGYVRTLGLEMLAGRDVSFERDFKEVAQPDGSTTYTSDSCLLNEEGVSRLGWTTSEEALDRFVRVADQQLRVVGVVRDFHLRTLHDQIEPLFITFGGAGIFAIRFVPGDPVETLGELEAMWEESTPDIPFIYSFLDEDVERLYRSDQLLGRLVTMFAGLAVFTACLGLFGLAVFTARQRTREIGVRKVLGATIRQLVMLLSREYTILVLIANLAAWPVAYVVMDRWLEGFAYHAQISLLLFPLAGLIGFLIAWLSVSSQTLQAAAMNPVSALRRDQ